MGDKDVQPAKPAANPLLNNPDHTLHNWLSANDGKELVCGDCGARKSAVEEVKDGSK